MRKDWFKRFSNSTPFYIFFGCIGISIFVSGALSIYLQKTDMFFLGFFLLCIPAILSLPCIIFRFLSDMIEGKWEKIYDGVIIINFALIVILIIGATVYSNKHYKGCYDNEREYEQRF